MKRAILFVLILLGVFILVGCSTGRTEKAALLDIENLLENSKRARQLQGELVDIGQRLEQQYQEKETELSPEEGEDELNLIYQEYLDNKQRLESSLNEELNQVIREIVEEEDISIVLYRESVYFGGEDITEKVINRLDESFIEEGDTNNE